MSLTGGVEHGSDSVAVRTKSRLRFLPIAALAAGAVLAYFLTGDYLSLETVSENREALVGWPHRNRTSASPALLALTAY